MGFQSGINQIIGMTGAGIGLVKGLSKQAQASEKAKTNLTDEVKSKQTGTKSSTRNRIEDILREATNNSLSNEQYSRLAKNIKVVQRKESMGEIINGNKQ